MKRISKSQGQLSAQSLRTSGSTEEQVAASPNLERTNLVARRKLRARRRTRRFVGYGILIFTLIVLVLVVVIVVQANLGNPNTSSNSEPPIEDAENQSTNSDSSTLEPFVAPLTQTDATDDSTTEQNDRHDTDTDSDPGDVVDATNSTDSVHQAAELQRLMQLLRQAKLEIQAKEFARAKELLADARMAQVNSESLAMVERLDSVRYYVEEFWNAFAEGLVGIEGIELSINDQTMFVVSCDDETLVLKALGRIRRLSLDELPPKLVLTIADRAFNASAPSTLVFKGAYMAFEPKLGNEEARKTWELAATRGIDVGDLVRYLDDDYDLEIEEKATSSHE